MRWCFKKTRRSYQKERGGGGVIRRILSALRYLAPATHRSLKTARVSFVPVPLLAMDHGTMRLVVLDAVPAVASMKRPQGETVHSRTEEPRPRVSTPGLDAHGLHPLHDLRMAVVSGT